MVADSQPRSVLYQTIHSQPEVVRAVLQNAQGAAKRAAELLTGSRRVFLSGTGTSGHAAIVGESLLRLAGADAYATTNFDFATYPRRLGPDDALVTISHRGSKRYGAQAIARAREAGMRVVGVTGQGSPMEGQGLDLVIATAPQERSATHTASYTANLAALALIATRLGERAGGDVGELRLALDRLPDDIAALLGRESMVVPLANALAARGRLTVMGAGPNAATAREGALKVKESSYLSAEGVEVETALHGYLQAIEADDIVVVVAARGPALERVGDLVRALDLIGAQVVVVADERAVDALPPLVSVETPGARTVITYPTVPEALSPLLAVVPLQLLAAHTAACRGADADSFRADNPVYKKVNESYAL